MFKKSITILSMVACMMIFTGILKAGWLYTDEVHTIWYFSRGYQSGDTVYFVTTYRLIKKPKGIARFPDGGTSKELFAKVLLYSCDTDGDNLRLCGELETMQMGGNGIALSTIMRMKGNRLMVKYYGSNRRGDKVNRYHMFMWDVKEKTVTPVTALEDKKAIMKDMKGLWSKYRQESVKISALKKMIEGHTLAEWKLPSPLDYADKSTDDLFDDLVELKGDRYYRDAIIQAHTDILTGDRIDDLLRRIQKRKDSLEGYEQIDYRFTVADLEEKLRKQKNNR